MDPMTFNRLGNIRHEEIVAWSEEQQQGERVWKLSSLVAFFHQRTRSLKPERAAKLNTSVNASDC